jgi:hypothetical protein
VSIRTELTDLTQVASESTRLYGLLQDAVDHEIQQVGFMPDPATYGSAPSGSNGHHANGRNGNGNGHSEPAGLWRCSEKQTELILKIVRENNLDKNEVDRMAQDMFGAGVRQLDKLQASGLIDELLERHGGQRRNGRSRTRRASSTVSGDVRS